MKTRNFRLAYLLAVVLSLTVVYAMVGTKEEIPLVLSDTQMQKLVGSSGLQYYQCRYVSNGCDPNSTGTCLAEGSGSKKYFHWSIKYYCDYTGNSSDYCNQYNEAKTCLKYSYTDSNCQSYNSTTEYYYYTACNSSS